MATAAKTVYPHISKDPRVCSGRPCVEGTRVRVVDILALHEDGLSPEHYAEFRIMPSPAFSPSTREAGTVNESA